MASSSRQAFENMRAIMLIVAIVCLCFLLVIEYNTVRDNYAQSLQSQLEAEYAYDYACSLSSQIIKKAEYGENVYYSTALWVDCSDNNANETNRL